MGLLKAMATLAEDWDEVQASLAPDQIRGLNDLIAQFAGERDSGLSANIAERIMDLLVDWLPFTHPVLRALMDPEDRDSRRNSQQADRAWFAVARTLRARLGPSPPGTTFGDDDDL